MLYIILIVLLIFLLLNHTNIFHRKIRKNIKELKYSCTEDQWFKKEGNNNLIVFLHGMFSTPSTFENIGEILVDEGWDVYIPSLPASAFTLEELQTIGPWSWNESLLIIRDKLSNLPTHYQKKVLGGHSQGGSLAMQIMTEENDLFDALIIIASPINLYGNHLKIWQNIAIYLSGLLSFILPNGLVSKIKHHEERAKVEKFCDAEGIQYPYTIYNFIQGLEKLRPNLYKITKPLFLAYCTGDKLVHYQNIYKIMQSVSSTNIKEILYDISSIDEPYGHKHQLLNYSKTKDHLNQSIVNFLETL